MPASPAPRSTSPAPAAATTWPARPSRSCRTSTPSAPGRRSATPTWRWTAPGPSTRPGSVCSRVTSTSPWPWARDDRRRPSRRSSTRWRWIPTTWPPWGSTPSPSPPCRPGPCSTRARSPSGRWPRSPSAPDATPRAIPTPRCRGEFDVDDAPRGGVRPVAAAPPRPAADHRRRRGRGHRPEGPGQRAVRAAGVDHRIRPLRRAALPGHARPADLAVHHRRGRRGRPRGRRRSRSPSCRRPSPTRSRC